MEFVSETAAKLSAADIDNAAKTIGCEPAVVWAISDVESGGRGGFIADKRPVILFESHIFHALTNGQFDGSHPDISTSSWVHNYGAGGAHQYDRLNVAIALNRDAALRSASWGMFQILGMNFHLCGYNNVEDYVKEACVSEGYQLDQLVAFVQNSNIDQAMIDKNWSQFALHYNGPGQVEFYAGQMQKAYNRRAA